MINITSLIGHSQMDVGCHCLGSLFRQCQDKLRFTLHDDGSLTAGDKDRLRETLGDVVFVDRKVADEQVLPILQKFPACLKYRGDFTMGLKMFDSYLVPTEEPLLFCDSDILFLRPFRFPAPVRKGEAVYMQDSQQATALRAWDVKPFGPIEAVRRLNAGFIHIHTEDFDLERVESLFSDPKLEWIFRQRHHWIEQTVLAILATKLSTSFYDPNQITMASAKIKPVTPQQVAIHFVSSFRSNLYQYLDYRPEAWEPVQLKLQKTRKVSALDILSTDVKKRLKRS